MTSSQPQTGQGWYARVEKTSETDDERIKDINVLPPPEHLIRFFPIRGTAMESLITGTRRAGSTTSWRAATTVCWW